VTASPTRVRRRRRALRSRRRRHRPRLRLRRGRPTTQSPDNDSDDNGVPDGTADSDRDGQANEDKDNQDVDSCDGDRHGDGRDDEDDGDRFGTVQSFDAAPGTLVVDTVAGYPLSAQVTEGTEIERERGDRPGGRAHDDDDDQDDEEQVGPRRSWPTPASRNSNSTTRTHDQRDQAALNLRKTDAEPSARVRW
jgi:hypothetical protein